jgi:TonB-dependent starch-binding outer membrane protein SusC
MIRFATIALALFATAAAAQQPLIQGVVIDDESGAPLSGASVNVSPPARQTQTDSLGRFRLRSLPGQRLLRVTALGYDTVVAEIDPSAGGEVEIRMTRRAVPVAGLTVTGVSRSRGLGGFEARRAGHTGSGRFMDRRALAQRESSPLAEVLRGQIPGLRLIRGRGGELYAASGTANAPGALRGPPRPCYTQVFVDGVRVYGQRSSGEDNPTDLNQYGPAALEALEFYRHASSTPVEFRTETSQCGTLVLWTRRS